MSMDGHKITGVEPGSIAEELELEKDDVLLRINGTEIVDVLDYIEWMGNESLELLIRKADGEEWEIQLEKEPGEDLGLKFEHDLMDQERTCRNKCIFCFVDQLPKGMRDSLYYKDDDWRLSFLVGNYITLPTFPIAMLTGLWKSISVRSLFLYTPPTPSCAGKC
jgi:NifB/MoaA-like Fe-S oxidoreductase